MAKAPKRPNVIGSVRANRGRWRASYKRHGMIHTPGHTFTTEELAWSWLRAEQALIDAATWTPPAQRRATAEAEQELADLTFDAYARRWVDNRVTPKGTPLHPRTRGEYLNYLDGILKPLASLPLVEITSATVSRWYADASKTPALRHKAYAFAKSVFKTAIEVEELATVNPFTKVENATRKPPPKITADKAVRAVTHDTVSTLAELVQQRDKALVLLLAYCGLRTSEACALRRRDMAVDPDDGLTWVTVERAISTYDRNRHESTTKTGELGERIVPVPPHILPVLTAHVEKSAERGDDGLLFPSTNPTISFRTTQQINGHAETTKRRGYGWYQARREVGLPTLRLHWLRHWAATVWAETGIPEPLRKAILGHAQEGMTGHYTHPDMKKAGPYAIALSELATGKPLPSSTASTPAASSPLVTVLASLDGEALAQAVAALDATTLAELIPLLPPDQVAKVIAAMKGTNP